MLLGRRSEREVLDRLLEGARTGRSGALVIRGDAGVGKTALLDYAAESAGDLTVPRTLGVESERELAFAGLQQLCAPLDGLDGLPGPQRDALAITFGLSAGPVPDRFLVGLAVLSLLSDSAEERPVLCAIDDAQWLDTASAHALAFVARRLLAESVVMLFAAREAGDELHGLPELAVEGLADDDARELLATVLQRPLDERMRDQILVEMRGNPLALLELPRGLTTAQLAAGSSLLSAQSLSGRIEESFLQRLRDLPRDSQRLLLVAAAEPLGDPALLWRAADRLAIARPAFEPAESAGLVQVGTTLQFRHPLVRSAIYRAAAPEERRRVHRALAEASDAEADPDRRAWHLAEATTGPDEDVASELERSAGRAQRRGGLAAAAAFLERAARLSPDERQRALRQLRAASAYLTAGAPDFAQRLIAHSRQHLEDPALRAQAMRTEGAIRFLEGDGGDTPTLLFDAAMTIRDSDPLQARDILMEAFEAAMWAGRLATGTTMLDVARAARQIPPSEEGQSVSSLLLSGYAERLTSGYTNAVQWWRRAAEVSLSEVEPHPWQGMVRNATMERFDFHGSVAIARQRLRLVREHGALASLPVALNAVASCEVWSGHLAAAEALMAESDTIAAAIGAARSPEGTRERAHPHGVRVEQLVVLSWRGREAEAKQLAQTVTEEALARCQGYAAGMAQ